MEEVDIRSSASPGPSSSSSSGGGGAGAGGGSVQVWTRESVPGDLWLPADVERISTCELEVDALFSDITNRLQVGGKT